MSLLLSKKSEYAIQSLLYLTLTEEGAAVTSGEIADHLKIPKEFVSKILQELTNSGFIESRKGKGGGFLLGKNPKEIYLIEVVKAIEGKNVFDGCVLGFPGCSDQYPCAVHTDWIKLVEETRVMLGSRNLHQLAQKTVVKLDAIRNKLI
ncbi:MAG: Rrf2 family transcriptional regulator [Ignavibacteriales bacterium]|nr:putative HTH-type transcriptional regulator [Ignavibacteriaceae bacterium]MCK6614430.1 Rrf2 family transcriptional regulator [Ignavibacteriaceae bacterium]QOJ29831.1 MAG: Rrf2 family transcriptional regulator [Ignavibacteriales bacterium]